jgi:hypothetical protein
MTDPNITIVLTTGKEITVPLSRYKVLPNGIVQLNTEEGKYEILFMGIAYIFKEKVSAKESKNDKKTVEAKT